MTAPKPKTSTHTDGSQYSFGSFSLRPDGTLLRENAPVLLSPKELAILRVLVSNAGQIVPADQLRLSAWGNVHVSADSLPRCVSSLRAHLDSQDCIQTVYKRGYRFMLAVKQTHHQQQREKETERRTFSSINPLRLAILPFATTDGVPEFLGPGIWEETMLRLSRVRNPVVDLMARDSVFNLAGHGATAREVGTALGADLALTGAVTALPQSFRLRTEMIRVADAVQLWVEDFLVPRNLVANTDAILAKSITARIQNTFATSTAATPIVSTVETWRSEAYTIYLQACAQWNTLERHEMQDAVRGFQHALDLDSNMLEARVRLAHGYLALSSFGYMRPDIAAELARKHAELALALSPDEQSIYPALGWIRFHHDRDFAAAAEAFAYPQRPGYNPWTVIYQARSALSQGRFSEAISLLRTAIDADPYSPVMHGRLAWALHLAGDSNAALEQARRTHRLFPNHSGAMFFCVIVFAAACKPGDSTSELAAQAMALVTRLVQDSPSLDTAGATLAYVQARQGCFSEAQALLDHQQWLSRERFVMRSFHAPALVELGEFEAAIEALVTAEQQHCPWFFELLYDPRLQPLHGEQGFQCLIHLSRQDVTAGASVA
jgi:DNA-binding winged helix-turn-helix (wHTH) protein/tetratricopeptide (TPR) repeat protein